MKNLPKAILILLLLAMPRLLEAQAERIMVRAGAPPKVLLLVYQQFKPGAAAAARHKLEEAATAYERYNIPAQFIDMEAVTGSAGTLCLDPFDSFEAVEKAAAAIADANSRHSDLVRAQQMIDELVTRQTTLTALRRDDLGYHTDTFDLSKARYLRILVARVAPGHEADFAEETKALAASYEKADSKFPWAVYQVDLGMERPAYIFLVPLRSLKDLDDLLASSNSRQRDASEAERQHMQQLVREAYLSLESNLYAISPELSHVSKDFVAADPGFWKPKRK
ncbi:MAG: hypothetical protein LAO31_18045 [Acidobacteriia bacterium]|nr:hypothetical protein [Terriglobia bacterium]